MPVGSDVVTSNVPKWKVHSTILPLMMPSSDRDAGAMGAHIRRGTDRTIYPIKSDLRSSGQGSLLDLFLDDLVGSTKYDYFSHETQT